MGKSLQDLGLKDEVLPTAGQALADLPEFGSFREPPQPGAYRFQLRGGALIELRGRDVDGHRDNGSGNCDALSSW